MYRFIGEVGVFEDDGYVKADRAVRVGCEFVIVVLGGGGRFCDMFDVKRADWGCWLRGLRCPVLLVSCEFYCCMHF